MKRIHIYIAGPVDNMYYLIIVDSYSMYPCTNISTNTIIAKLSEFYSIVGFEMLKLLFWTAVHNFQVQLTKNFAYVKWKGRKVF